MWKSALYVHAQRTVCTTQLSKVNIVIGVVLGEVLVARVVPLVVDAVIGLALSLIAHVVIVVLVVAIFNRIFLYGRCTLYKLLELQDLDWFVLVSGSIVLPGGMLVRTLKKKRFRTSATTRTKEYKPHICTIRKPFFPPNISSDAQTKRTRRRFLTRETNDGKSPAVRQEMCRLEILGMCRPLEQR